MAALSRRSDCALLDPPGAAPTAERPGSVAEAVAAVLSAQERAGVSLPDLLTFRERQKRYPNGEFSVTRKRASR